MKNLAKLNLLFTSAALALAGCGVVTAPISVPAAIASNADFSLHAPVLDNQGAPLDDVVLTQELNHYLWTPVVGEHTTDEHKLLKVSRHVDVTERGSHLQLSFSKPGFHTAEYTFEAHPSDVISTPQGDWPATESLPVVLYPDKPDALLHEWGGMMSCADYPRETMVDLDALARRDQIPRFQATSVQDIAGIDKLRAGILYLTLTPQTPAAIDSKGTLDPVDINLPAELTLHITGPNNGFAPMPTRLGFAPFQANAMAPTQGYAPTLTIPRDRLRAMRTAKMNLILEPREYFFFHANAYYGKGSIAWSRQVDKASGQTEPAEFEVELFVHPQADDIDLTSFDTGACGCQ